MRRIVFLRHGESVWDLEDRLAGWTDIDLSPKGRSDALAAGNQLREAGFNFDFAFTSVLKRAVRSLWTVLEELDQMFVPIDMSWRLNQRHYGAAQGKQKAEVIAEYGEEQLRRWGRRFDERPPAVNFDDPRFPGHDPKYRRLRRPQLPLTESLRDTFNRCVPHWHSHILPRINSGEDVLVVAHGNTLRVLLKLLDRISEEQVGLLLIPRGVPLVYELDGRSQPVSRVFLGNSEPARQAQAALELATAQPAGLEGLNYEAPAAAGLAVGFGSRV
jgi:2,3-bisphosphoglycerate-dependent phosphoglycerate mutase